MVNFDFIWDYLEPESHSNQLEICTEKGMQTCTTIYGQCTNFKVDCGSIDQCIYCQLTDKAGQEFCGSKESCIQNHWWIYAILIGAIFGLCLIGYLVNYIKTKKQEQKNDDLIEQEKKQEEDINDIQIHSKKYKNQQFEQENLQFLLQNDQSYIGDQIQQDDNA
ncbi:hypothetical protein PPERSA_03735 [Pseudocohnilembus persalinus]|uniref:Transmembrane protein n=1 Tax=Pseudocohnilembus persalinus TaxID=266149 RepID=A0A0V0QH66_PSEPJ|nr:hypothetical protein PPERSA_03735 [Pseudocohnilembus persalinus]|eukprot:KRX01651.1 hypothetical protein PPERSA_03735 [Pseudocohnilembus persalinus]